LVESVLKIKIKYYIYDFLKITREMKMNVNSIVLALCYILALYGLIVLIRKIMSDDKDKKWFSEQYRYTPCVCGGQWDGSRYVQGCTGDCGGSWD
jgi:hypothetical protein